MEKGDKNILKIIFFTLSTSYRKKVNTASSRVKLTSYIQKAKRLLKNEEKLLENPFPCKMKYG